MRQMPRSARELAEQTVARKLGVTVREVQLRESQDPETYQQVQNELYNRLGIGRNK